MPLIRMAEVSDERGVGDQADGLHQRGASRAERAMPGWGAGSPAIGAGSGARRSYWVHRYNDFGVEGLTSRLSPGRAPALSEHQMAELRDLVINGPSPEIHKVVRWRCVDLKAEVARRFSVKVHESTIARWLHELGLTRLQPRPVHPQKDPEAEATFKKTSPTWSERRSLKSRSAGR